MPLHLAQFKNFLSKKEARHAEKNTFKDSWVDTFIGLLFLNELRPILHFLNLFIQILVMIYKDEGLSEIMKEHSDSKFKSQLSLPLLFLTLQAGYPNDHS